MCESIIGDYRPFLDRIFERIKETGIDVSNYQLDHLCYRVENNVLYEEKKKDLLQVGTLLHEAIVGGRMIATFKLNEPMIYNEREIYLVELPSVKDSSPYPNGLEHVEFVIDRDFESFMNLYPHLQFDLKAITKESNPDIALKLGEYSVKFHHQPLDKVIEEELRSNQK